MNKAFTAVAFEAKNHFQPTPNHTQQVQRLYRASLRVLQSWAVDRQVFLSEAEQLRKRFDQNKHVDKGIQGPALVEMGYQELESYAHPDSYVIPWMPGGSKFMRNPPPPPDVVYYHDGHSHPPPEASKGTNTPVWPDMVPISFRPKSQVSGYLVDFAKKNME
jgi:NADH dehydrogenase (ubiquinone) 1 beta subcomplex subunit 9